MSNAAITWAKKQATGSPTLKAVLVSVADYADESGCCWPSQKRIATDTEFSERAVRGALAALEAKGFLRRTSRKDPSRNSCISDMIELSMARPARTATSANAVVKARSSQWRSEGRTLGTESPIEHLMFVAICEMLDGIPGLGQLEGYPWPEMWTQFKINNYRVDILIRTQSKSGAEKQLVVECDGHDFHDRTKEQAASDRERDRLIQLTGMPVFRFTGSEIYRDPLGCADCVKQWLIQAWES